MITTNKGRFNFITEQVLRDNLNQVFSDILSFVSIMDTYSEELQIICAKRYKKKRKITKSTHFRQLNIFALSKKIISEALFNEIEKVRKMRNRIHLAPLEDVENKYTKHTLNTVFETAHKVVQLVETKT